MNYLIYPLKIMYITQNYTDKYSHHLNYLGKPNDYPIDDNCGSPSKSGYFYCPCDEMVVKKIYGVGGKAGNTLWLESTSKVNTPTFNDYVTILIVHPNDSDFKGIYVGKKYKRYDKIIKEGNDGRATGHHFHISVGRGKLKGTGMQKNNLNGWVINTTGGSVKPEDSFYINKEFTTIKNSKGINFKNIPNYSNDYYVTYDLNVRTGPSTKYKILNTLPKNTKVCVLEIKNNWAKISDIEWISFNYLTKNIPSKYYLTKRTTAYYLNVRNKPNGTKSNYKAPLKKGTTVAIMKTSGNWTQINYNRWVFSSYLK